MKIPRHPETGFFRAVNPAPRATPRLMAAVLTLAVLALLAVLACGCAGRNVAAENTWHVERPASSMELRWAWNQLLPIVQEVGACAEERRPPSLALHQQLIEVWRALNVEAEVPEPTPAPKEIAPDIRGPVEQRAAAADAELPPQEGAPP